MTEEVEYKTCCGCLKKADTSRMYYFNDPVVLDMYQECTNIWIEEDQYVPQQLCALCYKQCEVAKYFKEQCEASFSKVIGKYSKKYKKKTMNEQAPVPVAIPKVKQYEDPIELKEEPLPKVAVYKSHSEQHDFFEDDPEDDQGHVKEDNTEVDEDSEELSDAEESECSESPSKKSRVAAPAKQFDTSKLDPEAALALPEGSRKFYIKTYGDFVTWKEEAGLGETTEDVLLNYLHHLTLTKNHKAPDLICSHLKATLKVFEGISIGDFQRLKTYVRDTSNAIVRKKAPKMTRKHLVKFIRKAPDEQYSTVKVVVALLLAGCTRADEIYEVMRSQVDDRKTHMEIIGVGARKSRYIIQPSAADGYDPVPMIRQYLSKVDDDSPWLLRGKGKHARVGLKNIQSMPMAVAKFLKLKDPTSYTMISVRQDRKER